MDFCIPLEHKNSAGIYSITNLVNGKRLIGSTNNFRKRFQKYKDDLKNNRYKSPYFLGAYNKYGTDSFKIELINLCSKENLLEMEDYYIMSFNTMDRRYGYNLQLASRTSGMLGKHHTEESKLKVSLANKGHKYLLGHKWTEEHIKNSILSHIKSEKVKEYKNKQKTEEYRNKQRKLNIGRKHNELSCKNMSIGQKNSYINNPERKLKCAAFKGKKHSPETIKKMKLARQKYWDNKK